MSDMLWNWSTTFICGYSSMSVLTSLVFGKTIIHQHILRIQKYLQCVHNNSQSSTVVYINQRKSKVLRQHSLHGENSSIGFYWIKLMKGKALRKHSLHEKTAASVLLKLFISGNKWCHTHWRPLAHERNSIFKCKQHTCTLHDPWGPEKYSCTMM